MADNDSFLSGLWDWFASVAMPWLSSLVRGALEKVTPFLLVVVKMAAFSYTVTVGVWSLITWAWSFCLDQFQVMLSTNWPAVQGNLVVYYTFINRLVPLSETIATAIVVFNIWVAVVVVRWVKSIIPTLSN